jgi:hypothetical protein
MCDCVVVILGLFGHLEARGVFDQEEKLGLVWSGQVGVCCALKCCSQRGPYPEIMQRMVLYHHMACFRLIAIIVFVGACRLATIHSWTLTSPFLHSGYSVRALFEPQHIIG